MCFWRVDENYCSLKYYCGNNSAPLGSLKITKLFLGKSGFLNMKEISDIQSESAILTTVVYTLLIFLLSAEVRIVFLPFACTVSALTSEDLV